MRHVVAYRFTPFIVLLVALLVMGASCGTKTDPFIVSGETLDRAGAAFLITAKAMDQALDSKLIGPERYNAWKKVGLEFQRDYRPAVNAWKAAVAANDALKQQESEAKIRGLMAAVADFGLAVGVRVYDIINQKSS